MTTSKAIAVGVTCFVMGAGLQARFAQARRSPAFTLDLIKDKPPAEAAAVLLDGARQLAGSGSWERIAVGRAWYLGGEKARGQQILDEVTSSPKVEGSDWFRVGRIYAEAGEWDRAAAAFDRAMAMDTGDDSGLLEYAALANLHHDRAKAESLFAQVFAKKPREFWHWVNAGGSYLGVKPE